MIKTNKIIDFLSTSNNFALLLSSFVSICVAVCTAIVSIHQSKNQYKEKSMSLFFESQLRAYTELYKAAAELQRDLKPKETRDIRSLIIAAKNAEIISTAPVASIIDKFCAIFTDFLIKEDNNETSENDMKDFQDSLKTMTIYIREELLRFDSQNKRAKMKRKKLQKLYYRTISKDD